VSIGEASELTSSDLQKSSTIEVAPFGALQSLIDDTGIEEIWINSPQRIYIARGGKSELTNISQCCATRRESNNNRRSIRIKA